MPPDALLQRPAGVWIVVRGHDPRGRKANGLCVGGALQKVPVRRPKPRPGHEGEITMAARRPVLGHQGRFKGERPGAAHGIEQKLFARVSGQHERCRRERFPQRGRARVGFDPATVQILPTAVKGGREAVVGAADEYLLRHPGLRNRKSRQAFGDRGLHPFGDGIRMMQPAVVGGDMDPQRGTRRDEKLPGQGGGLLRERAEIRCPEFVQPQENAIGRAQAEVGKVGRLQPAGELDPAFDRRPGQPQRFQFAAAERFKPGSRDREEPVRFPDDVAADSFFQRAGHAF